MNAAGPGSFPEAVSGFSLSEDVWVEGFTVTSDLIGIDGAGFSFTPDAVTATFKGCVFRDMGHGNSSEGAIGASNPVRILDCQFLNIDGVTGSAIRALGSVEVSGSLFENCSSGAISLDESFVPGPNRTATFTNTVFRNNFKDTGGGGAIYVFGYDVVEVSDCVFEGNVSTGVAGGIAVLISGGTAEVRGSVFLDNHANGGGFGGAGCLHAGSLTVVGNTFYACTQPSLSIGGSAMRMEGDVTFHNNIIAACTGAQAVSLDGTIVTSCNAYWGNTDGDTQGFGMGLADFIADPRFCDPSIGDLTLRKNSPCLPPNSGGCGLIGALGMGCGVISVESVSWGELKGRYR